MQGSDSRPRYLVSYCLILSLKLSNKVQFIAKNKKRNKVQFIAKITVLDMRKIDRHIYIIHVAITLPE